MTDKKPKVNTLAYTELSIQIATLSAKVDKLLELAMKQQQPVKYWVCSEDGSPGKWEEKNLSDDEQFGESFK